MSSDLSEERRREKIEAARRAIQKTAQRVGKPVEQVRNEIKEAMQAGWNNPDPQKQLLWQQVPCEDAMPTPEELVAWIIQKISDDVQKST